MAKMGFRQSDIRNRMAKGFAFIEEQIIIRLQYLGEECVGIARSTNSYTDQTGNLRSSIGYVILKHGKVIMQNFVSVKSGSEGVRIGENYAKELSDKYPDGFVLLVCAGMPYANVLESRGTDVLTTAEQYAEQDMPDVIRRLKASINSMKI